MPWMEMILALLFGLLIGSFLNVCIFRLPRDLSVVAPRSFCPGCVEAAEEKGMDFDAALKAGQIPSYDLIPVVSYLLLGGRCRRCKTKIPVRYPLVELATGLAFAGCIALFGVTLVALKYAIYAAIMITLTVTDFEERILPDEFTLGGIGVGVLLAAFVPMAPGIASLFLGTWLGPGATLRVFSIGESVIGAAVSSGLIWLLAFAYQKIRGREGMGMGDVKMIATIGAFLGLSLALFALVLASLLGTVIGGLFILIAGKKASEYELPFGSFLGIAAVLAALYGELAMKS